MKRKLVLLLSSMVMIGSQSAFADNAATAKKLTSLLVAARSVVAGEKKLIDSPKGALDYEKFYDKMDKAYKKVAGDKLTTDDGPTKSMVAAIKEVVEKAYTGGYATAWPEGDYKNKFLPARFAGEVTKAFNAKEKSMFMRLTTRKDFLINEKDNKADDWENKVIEERFVKAGEKNPIQEVAQRDGKAAWRYILPESYSGACMACHGGPAGQKNHKLSGIPGKVNEFGGAISFGIYN